MKRSIRKVAILGSGVMGSRIACHFAGCGLQVLLLDRIPSETNSANRNQLVNTSLQAAIKSQPSPLYTASLVSNIKTGNFTDNLKDIADYDWILEVVVENLEVKKQIFAEAEKYRKGGTLITSNTSGIPIHLLTEGRSEDFKKHFCGTHFFNPPRYLRLLEIIPTPDTAQEVIHFLMHYGDQYLGKTTVLCKDTPAFIANRIGVFSIFSIFSIADQLDLSIDEIDLYTGPLLGRPKSATFRTADVVGIDTLVNVARGVAFNCPNDEQGNIFNIPSWLQQMVDQKWLGDKTGQGFYKKIKNSQGEKEILTLDLKTLQYEPRKKTKSPTIEQAKLEDHLHERIRILMNGKDKAGAFYRNFHYSLFAYIAHRIPEITEELFQIDEAMKAGFGWEIGAFETWDLLGLEETSIQMKAAGYLLPSWIESMLQNGHKQFFKTVEGKKFYYDPRSESYKQITGGAAYIVMKQFADQTVWKNNACRTYHLENDVIGLEWNTKMGSIGGEVLEGIQHSISLAEEKFKGLVIANESQNFSAGANVGMIFMMAIEQEYEELDMAIRLFQNTMMRARYSSVPVVVAPHALTLGGACELSLHADSVCAAAETYIGLVEMGVGLIPGGGGTKEFVLRAAEEMHEDEPETITLKNRFLTIATAKVATSAHEAYQMGILRNGQDEIVYNQNRRISTAKNAVLSLYNSGYQQPMPSNHIKVLGRQGLGALLAGVHNMQTAGYATTHEAFVARKLAYVMCGGDLSAPSLVTEQYLLDLEREAFLSLCGEKKTLERIQSVLKTGKPIRN